MTRFKIGDRVRPASALEAQRTGTIFGETYTVSHYFEQKGMIGLAELGNTRAAWFAERFEKVETTYFDGAQLAQESITLDASSITSGHLVVPGHIECDVTVFEQSPYHLRPFDFEAGDERSFDRDQALAKAHRRTKDRGCRQQVRRVRQDPQDDRLSPAWLIQDI
jgi:hypothetical protein